MTETVIDGLAELDAALKDLPARVEANLLRGGLRAAARVIEDEARRLVPKKTGLLAESIRVSGRVDKREGKVVYRIIAGGNKKGQAFYAHIVEYGTRLHYIKGPLALGGKMVSGVDHPGAKEHPFMRPALDTKTQPAIAAMADYIRARLHKLEVRGAKALPGIK